MTSRSYLVLIPSYNTGPVLVPTVRAALAQWPDVWVVIDGSTDASQRALEPLVSEQPGFKMLSLKANQGKGAAVLFAATKALEAGFSHALVMDADGQHPATHIRPFIDASRSRPSAMVLGRPVFGPEAPALRLQGRKISIALVRVELLGPGVDDPLFGFRVYPLKPLIAAMQSTPFARHYDFDPEVAVRLVWSGTEPINLPAPCRYLGPREGGVSHFRYFRDNLRMAWLHTRLIAELVIWRWTRVARFGNKHP